MTMEIIRRVMLAIGVFCFCTGLSMGTMLGILWLDYKAKEIAKK